jgi:hypothetical protein
MNAWVHNNISNESSHDLILVDKNVSGSKNYKWQSAEREPPAKIPAKTAERPAYVAWAEDLIAAKVYTDVTYEASVVGFVLRVELGAGAQDTLGPAIPPVFEVSKPNILNVYHRRVGDHGEIEVYWTIRDWPD